MDPDIVVVPPANCLELGLAAGALLTVGITALFAVLFLQLTTMVWPPSRSHGHLNTEPPRRPTASELPPADDLFSEAVESTPRVAALLAARSRSCEMCAEGDVPLALEAGQPRVHLICGGRVVAPCTAAQR